MQLLLQLILVNNIFITNKEIPCPLTAIHFPSKSLELGNLSPVDLPIWWLFEPVL
jgi:hypothetical protein